MKKKIRIVGAGLAGAEAALYLTNKNYDIELLDIKPKQFSAAHTNGNFAELVCSNSLKGKSLTTSNGLLKEELRLLGSSLLQIADTVSVDAGGALAVDRDAFAHAVTEKLKSASDIEIKCAEYSDLDFSVPTIIATGPLTTNRLASNLKQALGGEYLYFYDAAAPIIDTDTIDFDHAFYGSRYNKGGDDYINCPLTKEQYYDFVKNLVSAETVILKSFEKKEIFEGCMPIEIMAKRGIDSLRYGNLKPVGIYDKENKRPFAVVQLRAENAEKTMYNLVGFQTNLTFKEQRRVFGLIPALKIAEYCRYGVMHRNTFVDAPKSINSTFQSLVNPNLYICGQLSGVEGYVESMMSGLVGAINLHRSLSGGEPFILPKETMTGAIIQRLVSNQYDFQPVPSNFGLLPPFDCRYKSKQEKYEAYARRALDIIVRLI